MRALPWNATMSRRLRDPELTAFIQTRVMAMKHVPSTPPIGGHEPWILDAKPLPVSGHSGERDMGVGRTTGGIGRGCKLHAFVGL